MAERKPPPRPPARPDPPPEPPPEPPPAPSLPPAVQRALHYLRTAEGGPVNLTQAEFQQARAQVGVEQANELNQLLRLGDLRLIDNQVDAETLDARARAQAEGQATLEDVVKEILREGRA